MQRWRARKFPQMAVYGKAGSGGGGITITPTDAQTQNPASASGSFTLNIGPASTDRIVQLAISAAGSTIAGFTLGGTAINQIAVTTTGWASGLFYLSVPTGTTAVLAYPGGYSNISVAVEVLKGQSAGASATPSSSVIYNTSGSQPLTVSLTVPSGGIGVAGAFGFGDATTQTYTWTGTTSGSGDETTNNTGTSLSMAHCTATGTIGVSSSAGLGGGGSMVAAAWAP